MTPLNLRLSLFEIWKLLEFHQALSVNIPPAE
jgi:hypothetical protein